MGNWKMRKLEKRQRGQTILEVLMATLVVGMVMVAIASVLTLSVKNTAESRYRGLATAQAQEALEVFRRERVKLGWPAFTAATSGGSYCLNTLPSSNDDLATYLVARNEPCEDAYELAGTSFYRNVIIYQEGSGISVSEVAVEVKVMWMDGDQERSVELVQEFRERN